MTEQPADASPSLPRASVAGLDAHRFAITDLVNDLHVNETEVLEAYKSELGEFLDARIQMFVPLLVGKEEVARPPSGVDGNRGYGPAHTEARAYEEGTFESQDA